MKKLHTNEIVENVCPYCGEHLLMNKKSFANHVRWCKSNPKYEEIRKKVSDTSKKLNKERFGEIKQFEVECANPKCKKHFFIESKENLFNKDKKYFCSISCANSHIVSDETKEKISNSIKEYILKNGGFGCLPKDVNFINKEKRICENCGNEFTPKTTKQKYCCNDCYESHKLVKLYMRKFNCAEEDIEKNKVLFSLYKRQCKFTFCIYDYTNEFNISLIKENGWYSASNRGNNLNGVSRDHKFSVNEGFKQKIDPYLISHPANCELILQNDNSSKHDKCSLTIDKLIQNVNEWNEKYGDYENKINYELLKEFKVLM